MNIRHACLKTRKRHALAQGWHIEWRSKECTAGLRELRSGNGRLHKPSLLVHVYTLSKGPCADIVCVGIEECNPREDEQKNLSGGREMKAARDHRRLRVAAPSSTERPQNQTPAPRQNKDIEGKSVTVY